MAECRYCTHLRWPETQGTAWEPVPWWCHKGWAVVDGEHGCADFEREVGTDDDLEDFQ